jgi:hypothetical protein
LELVEKINDLMKSETDDENVAVTALQMAYLAYGLKVHPQKPLEPSLTDWSRHATL